MRLIWIAGFALLVASVASLVSNQQSGRLMRQNWATTARVLPDAQLAGLQEAAPHYAAKVFNTLPTAVRQKFAAKTWSAVELMTFRSLVLWHLLPAFAIPLLVGFLEGSWARSNQKALIKMHSPMRFSAALTMLALTPVLALLWVAAPISISAILLVFVIGAIAIIGTRNLIVHAPTQF